MRDTTRQCAVNSFLIPPCAGTGGFLFTNPPFKMTDQPIAPGLPGLNEDDLVKLSIKSGYGPTPGGDRWHECLDLARAAYQRGADDQLKACAAWLCAPPYGFPGVAADMKTAMRPKPPSLKEMALAVLDDCNLDAAHENALRRALEALPE